MSFDYKKSQVYFGNGFVPFSEMNISLASGASLYGLAVYTVFNAIWDKHNDQLLMFRLAEHYERLCNSAKIIGLSDFGEQYSLAEFTGIMKSLLKNNKLKEDTFVRVVWFVDDLLKGTRAAGLKCTMAAFAYPAFTLYPGSGAKLKVSSWTRTSDNAVPPRAKVHGNYVNATLMKDEALADGYDDAIALDASGHVAEGTVTNICMVRDGVVISPSVSTDLLEGITVRTVRDLCKITEIPFIERPVDRTELYIADEVFLPGSSAGVVPVISIDKRTIGTGVKGPLTMKLNELYNDARLGKIPEFHNWVTPVYS